MTKVIQQHAKFLNVDLNLKSRWTLQPLVDELRERVHSLYIGRHKLTYLAHLELSKHPIKNADSAIRDFCKPIQTFSPGSRKVWDAARLRQFDIGIASGIEHPAYWCSIEAGTLRAAADLNASIAVTIYPAHMEVYEKPDGQELNSSSYDPSQDGNQSR